MGLIAVFGRSMIAVGALALPMLAESDPGGTAARLGLLTMALTEPVHGDATISLQELAVNDVVPKRARQLYEKALKSDRKGRTDLAIAQATEAINTFPGYFQAEAALAVAFLELGNTDEAQRHALIAAKLNPHYLPAQEIQGLIFYFQGRFREASDTLTEVVKSAPCRKMVHYYLSLALRQLGDYQKADYYLQTAVLLLRNPVLELPEDPAAWDANAFSVKRGSH